MKKFVSLAVCLGAMLVLLSTYTNSTGLVSPPELTVAAPPQEGEAKAPKFYCFIDTITVGQRSATMINMIFDEKDYHIAGQQWEFYYESEENLAKVQNWDIAVIAGFWYDDDGRRNCSELSGLVTCTQKYKVAGYDLNNFLGWYRFGHTIADGGYPEEEDYNKMTGDFLDLLADWHRELSNNLK